MKSKEDKSNMEEIIEEELKIWICNDCGRELLEPYCVYCCHNNVELTKDVRRK